MEEMLLDVEDAGFRILETYPPMFILDIRGNAPQAGMEVVLRPARAAGADGRRSVEVVGVRSGRGGRRPGPFDVEFDVTRTIGPRGLRLIGATRVVLLDHPDPADAVEGRACAGPVAAGPDVVEAVSEIDPEVRADADVVEGSDGFDPGVPDIGDEPVPGDPDMYEEPDPGRPDLGDGSSEREDPDADTVEESAEVLVVPEGLPAQRNGVDRFGPVVRGVVTDDSGWPLPAAWVVAYPAGSARCTADAAVRSDATGRFRLRLREAGRIRVVAEAGGFASASGETWVVVDRTGRVDLALTPVVRRGGPVADRRWEAAAAE